MPPEALGAWQHYLGCLLLVKSKDGFKRANRHARKCLSSLRKAHAAIMKNPQAKKLEDTEAVRPTSLLTFILNRVLSDFTGTQPDIVDSYWEYFDMLVSVNKQTTLDHTLLTISTGNTGRKRSFEPSKSSKNNSVNYRNQDRS
jgi:hypothetical protein